jgi:uncharacterized protein YndB with AHSA1/START domain
MSTPTATTTQTIQVAVRATPEQVWRALTDGATTPAYYFGFRAELDPAPGASYRYTAGGRDVITGRVLAVEPGRSVTMTFNGAWDPDVAALPESRVTFRLSPPAMPTPGVTILSVVHEELPDTETAAGLELGWVTIVSGLKTLLETGRPLVAAPADAG